MRVVFTFPTNKFLVLHEFIKTLGLHDLTPFPVRYILFISLNGSNWIANVRRWLNIQFPNFIPIIAQITSNDQQITFTNNVRWQICIPKSERKKVYHVLNIEQYHIRKRPTRTCYNYVFIHSSRFLQTNFSSA